MAKTILVFGASGTVGLGLTRVALEQGHKVVGIFRSEGCLKKASERLGNPPEDKFVSIIGCVATEQDGADLLKRVLEKVGNYTDIFASIGAFSFTTPLLEQSLDDVIKAVSTNKLEPNFVIAKYFLTHIQDMPGTSFTIINGGGAYSQSQPIPNFGHMSIASGAMHKFFQVISTELKDKPIRINEVAICCLVLPWENPTPPPGVSSTANLEMGKALLGVIVHPKSKGASMAVSVEHMSKLAQEGAL